MRAYIALGNPEPQYAYTRHNVGKLCLKKIVQTISPQLNWQYIKNLQSEIIKDNETLYILPDTYMNISGPTIKKVLEYYKIPAQNICVLHDELDIPVGEYKIQINRGSAGHNGVKSLFETFATQDFHRVRIGIGRPVENTIPVEEYVLTKISDSERIKLETLSEDIAQKISLLDLNQKK